jgi:hypothetical protein
MIGELDDEHVRDHGAIAVDNRGSIVDFSLQRRGNLDRLNLGLECAREGSVDDAVKGILEPFQQAHHASE